MTLPRQASILLVEDSIGEARLFAEWMRTTPSPLELHVFHVASLAEAGPHLARGEFDAVVLDLTLPDASGLAALEEIRRSAPGMPVVVLTGHADEETALAALAAGAQEYLTKAEADGPALGRALRYAIERKQAEILLTRQARHNPLTGLVNRVVFLERLAEALHPPAPAQTSVAVLAIDLDHFRSVNDSLGHEAGDRLICEAARRLESLARSTDLVAHLGGDEFLLLCADSTGGAGAVLRARAIIDALSVRTEVDGYVLHPSASVGIAVVASSREAPAQIVRDAGRALQTAKERGRGRVEVFQPAPSVSMSRIAIEGALHAAVEARELRLDYQPVIDLRDGSLAALEALVRWPAGKVGPATFIPVAEESSLILRLGQIVLEDAVARAAEWSAMLDSPPAVTVNVSACQVASPDLPALVAGTLARYGLPAARLHLEMTETAMIRDEARSAANLADLSEMGVGLWIDDFGTGHSALGYLRRFPFNGVKVDGSFVRGATASPVDAAILRAVADVGRALGLVTVAEGVETAAQADLVRSLGYTYGQGYHFGRPAPDLPVRPRAECAPAGTGLLLP